MRISGTEPSSVILSQKSNSKSWKVMPKNALTLTRVQYPKCAYGPYLKFNPIKNGVYILVEVSIWIIKLKPKGMV